MFTKGSGRVPPLRVCCTRHSFQVGWVAAAFVIAKEVVEDKTIWDSLVFE